MDRKNSRFEALASIKEVILSRMHLDREAAIWATSEALITAQPQLRKILGERQQAAEAQRRAEWVASQAVQNVAEAIPTVMEAQAQDLQEPIGLATVIDIGEGRQSQIRQQNARDQVSDAYGGQQNAA